MDDGQTDDLPGLGLSASLRAESAAALNRLLADSLVLRDLYKKHHWQTSGLTFYQLHLLFDRHYAAQAAIVDALAERVMTLGHTAVAVAQDVVAATRIDRAPAGREAPDRQIRRLLEAHGVILTFARARARDATAAGDDGTGDLVVSQVIRTGEEQVWMLAEHLKIVA